MRFLQVAICLLVFSLRPAGAANFLAYGYGPSNRGSTSEKLNLPLSLVWRFVTAPRQYSGVTPLVVDKDMFYAAGPRGGYSSEKPALYCLDVETGAVKWNVSTDEPARAVPVYANGLVWFGDDEGTLRAVDPAQQKAVWELEIGQAIRTPIVASGNMIYFGTSGRAIYAVDTQKRKKVWVFRPGDEVYGAPAVDGRTLYLAALDNALYALDARTGMERWRYQLSPGAALFGSPVIGSRYIFLAAGKRLIAIGKYGQHVRTQEFKNDLAGDPALADGMLYVAMRGVGTGAVYGIEELHGRVKWRYPADPNAASPVSPTCSPVVAGNLVLAGCSYGVTYALSAGDGKPLWRYLARRPVDPPTTGLRYAATGHAVVANGSLYMTYDDGTLCRFTHGAPDIAGPAITKMTPKPDSPMSAWPPFLVGANIYDEESGVDPSSVRLLLDGEELPCTLRLQNSDCFHRKAPTDPAEPIADGWHTVTVMAADYVGNKTEKSWRFLADRNYVEKGAVETPGEGVLPSPGVVPPYYQEEDDR